MTRILESIRSLFRTIMLGGSVCGLLALPLSAQPGLLDTSFGVGGIATIQPGSLPTTWEDSHVLPDDRVLLSGTCGAFPNQSICVARLLSNGALDASFGVAGFAMVVPSLPGVVRATGRRMAIEPDGRITVVGTCEGSVTGDVALCHARFSATGSLVDIGRYTFPGQTPYGAAIVAVRDGRRLLVAECGFAICLLMLRADNTVDSDFGNAGISVLYSNTDTFFKPQQVVESWWGGTFYIAATCIVASGFRPCVVGVGYQGDLMIGFGVGGRAIMSSAGSGEGAAVMLEPGRTMLLAGTCRVDVTRRHYCVSRLSEDGVFENTLGPGWIAHGVTSGDHRLHAALLQADGKIVLTGYCRPSAATTYDICLLRLKQNGQPDASFGVLRSGRNQLHFVDNVDHYPYSLSLRQQGELLLTARWAGTGGRALQVKGGPFGSPQCSLDLDGDGQHGTVIDSQILARIQFGLTGDAVLAGLPLAAWATRGNWPALRSFLNSQCGLRLP